MIPYPSDRMIILSEYDRGYANGQKDAETHICPFYEIDEDGHGVCKNVRYETVTEFADRCRECGAKYGKLLKQEQEPKTGQFAEWVAREIFDDNWEYNKEAFAEIACRKLAKLGIVRAKGDEWELVEPQESEEISDRNMKMWQEIFKAESDHKCHTCKHYTSGENDGSCGSYICKEYSNWESEG